jgi:hypothetical protein
MVMNSLNLLRQQAEALGITERQAKKYGNLRHKRTWSLAIEHYQLTENFAVDVDPKGAQTDADFPPDSPSNPTNVEDLPEPITISYQTLPSPNSTPENNYLDRVQSRQFFSFPEVVQKYIESLSIYVKFQDSQQLIKWDCPECQTQIASDCYLCLGHGKISDLMALAWTLTYMEFLGCSVEETAPLHQEYPDLNTLIVNLQICQTIKHTGDLLLRTEKWLEH